VSIVPGDLPDKLLQLRLTARSETDSFPFRGEQRGRRCSDAAARAGNDEGLVSEVHRQAFH